MAGGDGTKAGCIVEWWVLPVLLVAGSGVVAVVRVMWHNATRRRQERGVRRLRGENDALVGEMLRRWPDQQPAEIERWTQECQRIGQAFAAGPAGTGSLWSGVREEILFGGTILDAIQAGDTQTVTDARQSWDRHRHRR